MTTRTAPGNPPGPRFPTSPREKCAGFSRMSFIPRASHTPSIAAFIANGTFHTSRFRASGGYTVTQHSKSNSPANSATVEGPKRRAHISRASPLSAASCPVRVCRDARRAPFTDSPRGKGNQISITSACLSSWSEPYCRTSSPTSSLSQDVWRTDTVADACS